MDYSYLNRDVNLDYDFSDMLGAAFRQENMVGSAITHRSWREGLLGTGDQTPVGDKEVERAISDAGLNEYVEEFFEITTQGELDAKIHDIRTQSRDREMLQKGGFWKGMAATMIAGTFDATLLMPGAGLAKGASLGAKVSKMAAIGAVDAATSEAGLHATQDLRTLEESAFAVGGGVLLNGVLGTSFHYVGKAIDGKTKKSPEASAKEVAEKVEADVRDLASGAFDKKVEGVLASADKEIADAVAGKPVEAVEAIGGIADDIKAAAREILPDSVGVKVFDRIALEMDDLAIFAGTGAKTADKDRLRYAQVKEGLGSTRDETWLTTGWGRGLDGKWHWELDDSAARMEFDHKSFLPESFTGKLGDRFDHKSLIDAYPEAKDIEADIRGWYDNEGRDADKLTSTAGHQTKDGRTKVKADGGKSKVKNLTVHELEHFVQTKEGSQAGGNQNMWSPKAIAEETTRLRTEVAETGKLPDYLLKNFKELADKDAAKMASSRAVAKASLYIRLYGEVKARAVQAREKLTPLERRRRGPWKDYDVPEDLIITETRAAKTGLHDLKTVGRVATLGRDGGEAGAYSPSQTLIRIALSSDRNPFATLGHEAVHALRDLGLFTKDEWAIMRDAAKKAGFTKNDAVRKSMDAYKGRDYGQAKMDDILEEEAAAEAFAHWYVDSAPKEVRGLIARINQFIERFRNGMKGRGFRSLEDVHKAIAAGEVKSRTNGLTPSEYAFANADFAKGGRTVAKASRVLMRPLGRSIPLEMMAAKSPAMRKFISTMGDLGMRTQAAQDGVANEIAVQNLMARYDGYNNSVNETFRQNFSAWRKRTESLGHRVAHPTGNDDWGRFSQQVTRAILNGGQHTDPEVRAAAKEITRIHDDVLKRAVDVGIADETLLKGGADSATDFEATDVSKYLTEDSSPTRAGRKDKGTVDTKFLEHLENAGEDLTQNGRYIHRVYTGKVNDDFDEFVNLETVAWLQFREKSIADGTWKNTRWGKQGSQRSLSEMNKRQRQMVIDRAHRHAQKAAEVITMRGDTTEARKTPYAARRGYWKDRTVMLSDRILLSRGWISSDILEISEGITRTMGADIEVAKKFRKPKPKPVGQDTGDVPPETDPDLDLSYFRDRVKAHYDKEVHDARQKLKAAKDAMTAAGKKTPEQRRGLRAGARLTKEGREIVQLQNELNAWLDERARMIGATDSRGAEINPADSDIFAVRDIMAGTYKSEANMSKPAQLSAAARNYIYSAKMGGNVLSSTPDIAVQAFHHGFGRLGKTYYNGVKNLTSGLRGVERSTKNRRLARAAGITGDTQSMAQIAANLDIANPNANMRDETPFIKGSRSLARIATKAYGIQMWTNWVRQTNNAMSTERLLAAALDFGGLPKAEQAHMRDLGMSDDIAARIRKQVESGGATEERGFWEVDLDVWDDDDAVGYFLAMLRKDANVGNVMSTQLDKPKYMHHPLGALLLQFASFSLKSTQTLLGRSGQRIRNDGFGGSAGVLAGAGSMMAMGWGALTLHHMASNWSTDAEMLPDGALGLEGIGWSDREGLELPSFEDNPAWWIYQGIDRSGLLGAFGLLNNMAENANIPGAQMAAHQFLGDEDNLTPRARYGAFGGAKNLLGPSFGLLDDLTTIGGELTLNALDPDDPVSGSIPRTVRRNTALINAFYIRSLTDDYFTYLAEDVWELQ